jgi:hypothetical protein
MGRQQDTRMRSPSEYGGHLAVTIAAVETRAGHRQFSHRHEASSLTRLSYDIFDLFEFGEAVFQPLSQVQQIAYARTRTSGSHAT